MDDYRNENAMEKKYILTDETLEHFGHTLHRIQAIKDFGPISAGTLGGYIESETNLDHTGDAWVTDNAKVADTARVTGDARVAGDAKVTGHAWVADSARVADSAVVTGDAVVTGHAWVADNAKVTGHAVVTGNARVAGNASVSGSVIVSSNAAVHGPSDIALVKGFGSKFRTTSFFRCADGRVRCQCGCFYGTVDEFRSKVRETHGNSKYAKEYLMIADLMELHFKED